MKRIFPAFTYGPGPRQSCWWDETIDAPNWPCLSENKTADVAIIGAGFTGVSAALHLAQEGASVAVLEAETPGWGASGRNGGFCCLGGSKLSSAQMEQRFGPEAARDFARAEVASVALVQSLLSRFSIDADTHSRGETILAHNARAMAGLRRTLQAGGIDGMELAERSELDDLGMSGPFHGALTIPVGFGLNPRKYLFGLADAAVQAGARIFQKSPATDVVRDAGQYRVTTPAGALRAENVLIATNGYSSEDIPEWMAARYLPAQSSVLVTQPLTQEEQQAQGWTSAQMAYDTRNLLHYFRLMPDGRFLFGMRGGLMSSAQAEIAAQRRTRKDFERMFPAWAHVPSPHRWSGMVCLARNRVPFVGPIREKPGLFAGFAYHGNGVAMGSYAGRLLADLALNRPPEVPYPIMMRQPPPRFPLGRTRRLLMPPLYAALTLADL